MSTLPLPEAIMLEIHQSLGCEGYPTKKKEKFSTGRHSLKSHMDMAQKTLVSIFKALNMESRTQASALDFFEEFANAYKELELNTWSFAADQRQILWALLGHFYVPGLARCVGLCSLEQALDKGMPGGRFWYLPTPCVVKGKPNMLLPVAQVVDWLLDLLGQRLEQFADERSSASEEHEGLRRSLYHWRNETPIRPDSIRKYFSDDMTFAFNGAFTLNSKHTPAEQFADALDFVRRKKLDASKLRLEIPMTQAGRLETILDGCADEDEQAAFVECLTERYTAPSMRTIRQRFMLARMVQDGYLRLLKFLCPGVDRKCADAGQNKILQLFAIYKFTYNTTIDAARKFHDQGEAAEDAWFDNQMQSILFLSIRPSMKVISNKLLARWLTRLFFEIQAGDELEDHFGWDEHSTIIITQRNAERAALYTDEMNSVSQLIERMGKSSPWRILQGENRYWVIRQIAQHRYLDTRSRGIACQRLRELAATPAEIMPAILCELDGYLNGKRKGRTKDTQARVQALLDEAETCQGYEMWKAAILQYKAKHLLTSNDFEGAGKLFREALEAGFERNYGALRGEIALCCLAVAVAESKPIFNNHELYYREMLAGGMMDGYGEIPFFEDTARWASEYFWSDLYKPYPGTQTRTRRTLVIIKKIFEEVMQVILSDNQHNLQAWIKNNNQLMKSNLPDVNGDSILLSTIKQHTEIQHKLPQLQQILPGEYSKFTTMLTRWRQFLIQLVKDSPKQLNMVDFKQQTPLMLMAEAGDTEMVLTMLQAGADSEIQDWHGMTALHSACKAHVDSCVDALLDQPCKLDKVTIDGRTPLHTATWAGNMHAVNRLILLAPELAWKRDSHDMTPLELAEALIENPDALEELALVRAHDGKGCASRQKLEAIAQLLEQVSHSH